LATNVALFVDRLLITSAGYELSLNQRIVVAEQDGPRPVIYDLDWNPRPAMCRGKDAIAILACISSFVLHIYYYPRTTMRWTTFVRNSSPSPFHSPLLSCRHKNIVFIVCLCLNADLDHIAQTI